MNGEWSTVFSINCKRSCDNFTAGIESMLKSMGTVWRRGNWPGMFRMAALQAIFCWSFVQWQGSCLIHSRRGFDSLSSHRPSGRTSEQRREKPVTNKPGAWLYTALQLQARAAQPTARAFIQKFKRKALRWRKGVDANCQDAHEAEQEDYVKESAMSMQGSTPCPQQSGGIHVGYTDVSGISPMCGTNRNG